MKRGLKNTLLAMLGFSVAPMLTACYGTPYEPYCDNIEIDGTVTDENYDPIAGIRITSSPSEIDGYYSDSVDAIYTDAEGKFHTTTCVLTTLVAEDVDGESNGGSFLPATRKIVSAGDRNVVIVMKKTE